jgi:superfamily II DNA/RNA helicase
VPFNAEDYVHRIGRTGRAGASGLAVTLVSGSDARLVADIEKLIKKKIELEAVEYEEDQPKGRINDGRRAWREAGETGDGRDAISAAPRRERERERDHRGGRESREPREQHRGFRPAVASRDPFFEKPYEASAAADAAPAWEAAKSAPRSSISANIKPKRKVAALFKAAQPETSTQ